MIFWLKLPAHSARASLKLLQRGELIHDLIVTSRAQCAGLIEAPQAAIPLGCSWLTSRAQCAGLIEAELSRGFSSTTIETSRAQCAGLIEACWPCCRTAEVERTSRAQCAGLIEATSRGGRSPQSRKLPAHSARASLKPPAATFPRHSAS